MVVVVSWASSGMPPAKYKSRRTARLQQSERSAFDAAVAARIFCCRISTADGDESIFTIIGLASFFTPKTGFLLLFFPFVTEEVSGDGQLPKLLLVVAISLSVSSRST